MTRIETRRARAAKLKCPHCNSPIGKTAVSIAAELQRRRNLDIVSQIELKEGEIVDIDLKNLLPAVCPHCNAAHEFDLDELGIGPI